MSAVVMSIVDVRPHGENLSIVTTSGGNEVIANRKEDGSFRWEVGEPVIYVSEGSIIPDAVLKERGYWDEEKDRGLLDGGKRNRVKMKKLAGFESRGLLFKIIATPPSDSVPSGMIVDKTEVIDEGFVNTSMAIEPGQDVSEFLGITEFQG